MAKRKLDELVRSSFLRRLREKLNVKQGDLASKERSQATWSRKEQSPYEKMADLDFDEYSKALNAAAGTNFRGVDLQDLMREAKQLHIEDENGDSGSVPDKERNSRLERELDGLIESFIVRHGGGGQLNAVLSNLENRYERWRTEIHGFSDRVERSIDAFRKQSDHQDPIEPLKLLSDGKVSAPEVEDEISKRVIEQFGDVLSYLHRVGLPATVLLAGRLAVGKTTLLNELLGADGVFQTGSLEVTRIPTYLIHQDWKPRWMRDRHPKDRVFLLARGVDVNRWMVESELVGRSMQHCRYAAGDFSLLGEHAVIKDQKKAASAQSDYVAALVFTSNNAARNAIFVDSPGVGGLSEHQILDGLPESIDLLLYCSHTYQFLDSSDRYALRLLVERLSPLDLVDEEHGLRQVMLIGTSMEPASASEKFVADLRTRASILDDQFSREWANFKMRPSCLGDSPPPILFARRVFGVSLTSPNSGTNYENELRDLLGSILPEAIERTRYTRARWSRWRNMGWGADSPVSREASEARLAIDNFDLNKRKLKQIYQSREHFAERAEKKRDLVIADLRKLCTEAKSDMRELLRLYEGRDDLSYLKDLFRTLYEQNRYVTETARQTAERAFLEAALSDLRQKILVSHKDKVSEGCKYIERFAGNLDSLLPAELKRGGVLSPSEIVKSRTSDFVTARIDLASVSAPFLRLVFFDLMAVLQLRLGLRKGKDTLQDIIIRRAAMQIRESNLSDKITGAVDEYWASLIAATDHAHKDMIEQWSRTIMIAKKLGERSFEFSKAVQDLVDTVNREFDDLRKRPIADQFLNEIPGSDRTAGWPRGGEGKGISR